MQLKPAGFLLPYPFLRTNLSDLGIILDVLQQPACFCASRAWVAPVSSNLLATTFTFMISEGLRLFMYPYVSNRVNLICFKWLKMAMHCSHGSFLGELNYVLLLTHD